MGSSSPRMKSSPTLCVVREDFLSEALSSSVPLEMQFVRCGDLKHTTARTCKDGVRPRKSVSHRTPRLEEARFEPLVPSERGRPAELHLFYSVALVSIARVRLGRRGATRW